VLRVFERKRLDRRGVFVRGAALATSRGCTLTTFLKRHFVSSHFLKHGRLRELKTG
jgi:hypothetical protein